MKCTELQQQFDAYLVGLLQPEQCKSIEAHLATCTQCTKLLLVEDQELDVLLQSDWHFVYEPQHFSQAVMNKVQKRKDSTWLLWILAWVGYLSVWTVGIALVLFRHHLPRAFESAAQMGRIVRSMLNVVNLVLDSLQFFRLSAFGVFIILSAVAFGFVAIRLISKGEVLQ